MSWTLDRATVFTGPEGGDVVTPRTWPVRLEGKEEGITLWFNRPHATGATRYQLQIDSTHFAELMAAMTLAMTPQREED